MAKLVLFDIDGVLGNIHDVITPWHNKNYGTQLTVADYVVYHFSETWGCSAEESKQKQMQLTMALKISLSLLSFFDFTLLDVKLFAGLFLAKHTFENYEKTISCKTINQANSC